MKIDYGANYILHSTDISRPFIYILLLLHLKYKIYFLNVYIQVSRIYQYAAFMVIFIHEAHEYAVGRGCVDRHFHWAYYLLNYDIKLDFMQNNE